MPPTPPTPLPTPMPTPISLPVLDAQGRNYVLFDFQWYTGIHNLFKQLVINSVDTDAKRAAVAVFVDALKTVLQQIGLELFHKSDIYHKFIDDREHRVVVVRPDDALDTSLEGVTAWYMVDDRSFATAQAFMRLSTDRGAQQSGLLLKLSAVRRALSRGDADALEALWKDHSDEDKRALFDGLGGVHTAAQHALQYGHTLLLIVLIKTFGMSMDDLFGLKNEAFGRAVLACRIGTIESLKRLATIPVFDFFGDRFRFAHEAVRTGNLAALKYMLKQAETRQVSVTAEDVCGRNNSVFYDAVQRGHLEMAQFLVTYFDMGKTGQ